MNKAYRNVPPEQVEQLMRFRKEHPLQSLKADGITWEYLASGEPSGQALLLLPGALGFAESAWRTISLLEQLRKYRLVCPSYPAEVSTMTALADGVAVVLGKEGIGDTSVVGGSYGGMLAQVFTQRHQQRVTRLVLSHTYPPVRDRAKSVEPALRLFRVLPMFMLKKMLRDRMTGLLPPKPSPELALVAAQIRETVDTKVTRQAALNTFLRMVDFDQQDFSAKDLQGWQGKTLIMLSEDDPTTPEMLRQALLELYPGARLHLFRGSGHATAILESGEYIRLMDEFLSTPAQAR
jgi:pimeloyl-ACP methyl ester carboxylesterase